MKNFTLPELVIVIFCVWVLATLTIGMTPREDAREKVCADRVRKLLEVSHLYASDHRGMWMSPCNLPSGAWVSMRSSWGLPPLVDSISTSSVMPASRPMSFM